MQQPGHWPFPTFFMTESGLCNQVKGSPGLWFSPPFVTILDIAPPPAWGLWWRLEFELLVPSMAFVVPWVQAQPLSTGLLRLAVVKVTILDIAPPPAWGLWWRLGCVFAIMILDIAPPLAWGLWWRLGSWLRSANGVDSASRFADIGNPSTSNGICCPLGTLLLWLCLMQHAVAESAVTAA